MQRKSKWLLLVLCLFLGQGVLTGCGSSNAYIYIKTTDNTNDGRPFYVNLRYIKEKDFLSITYQDVSGDMFKKKDKEDPNQVATELVIPGKEKTIEIPLPEDQKLPLGVFFVFYKPQPKWKSLVSKPLSEAVTIELGVSEIKKLVKDE